MRELRFCLFRVALFGDNFNSRTNAGLFNWNFNNASSDSNWNIGARLININWKKDRK